MHLGNYLVGGCKITFASLFSSGHLYASVAALRASDIATMFLDDAGPQIQMSRNEEQGLRPHQDPRDLSPNFVHWRQRIQNLIATRGLFFSAM